MVLLSIKTLKASGTKGFTPGSRLSAWDAAATHSTYSALAVNIYFLRKCVLLSPQHCVSMLRNLKPRIQQS